MSDGELRDGVNDMRDGIERQSDELYGLMESVCECDGSDLDVVEDRIVEAMRKAEEVAKSAIKAVGVLDNLLHRVREAKEGS